MKPDSTSKTFGRLAEQLRQGCAQRGIHLREGTAEIVLADRINAVADTMATTDHHAMATYFTDHAIAELVVLCQRARAHQDTEIELASPILLPIPHAAAVIAALAASCQAATTAAHRTDTTTAIHEATIAILRITGAIGRAEESTPAILDAETAVVARTQLSTMFKHLTDGTWHMPGHEGLPDARQQDLDLADRIAADLEHL